MKRLGLFLVLLPLLACSHEQKDKEPAHTVTVHCAKPTKEAIEETITLRGRIAPPPGGDLLVASQVPGRLVTVNVKEGERVGAGDVVATVDDALTRDASRQADAALAQARSAEINANLVLERTRALVTRGIAAKQELDDAVAKADQAKQGVAAAVAGSDSAKRTLGRVQVRAGLTGLVTRVFRGPGALVDGTSATPLLQPAGTSTTELVADVTQRELLLLDEGQPVKGSVAGDPKLAFEGTVRSRPRALDPATGFGVVRIALTSAAASLPLGAFARAVVTVGKRDGSIVLPATSLRGPTADGATVALCLQNKAQIRSIEVGFQDETRVEVTKGVTLDDFVVLDHALAVDDETTILQAQ